MEQEEQRPGHQDHQDLQELVLPVGQRPGRPRPGQLGGRLQREEDEEVHHPAGRALCGRG